MATIKCRVGGEEHRHPSTAAARQCAVNAGKITEWHQRPVSDKQVTEIFRLLEIFEGTRLEAQVVAIYEVYSEQESILQGRASNLIEVLSNLQWLLTKEEKTKAGECPTCNASGDDPCTTSNGNEASKPHAARKDVSTAA